MADSFPEKHCPGVNYHPQWMGALVFIIASDITGATIRKYFNYFTLLNLDYD